MATMFKVKNSSGEVFTAYKSPGSRQEVTDLDSTRREYKEEGLSTYRLQNGTPLRKRDDQTFENLRTHEVLTVIE